MTKRDERLYLAEIAQACDAVERFTAGYRKEDFIGHEIARSAVVHQLTIIGEAASNISRPLRERFPQVPWRKVIALRNIIVHAYFAVDWMLIWEIAVKDVPGLKQQVNRILSEIS